MIRALNESGKLERAFCTETRPYNQGARLTAYELVAEQIPGTLVRTRTERSPSRPSFVSWLILPMADTLQVTDSMVAALMNSPNKPHAVIVGADRIAANG